MEDKGCLDRFKNLPRSYVKWSGSVLDNNPLSKNCFVCFWAVFFLFVCFVFGFLSRVHVVVIFETDTRNALMDVTCAVNALTISESVVPWGGGMISSKFQPIRHSFIHSMQVLFCTLKTGFFLIK